MLRLPRKLSRNNKIFFLTILYFPLVCIRCKLEDKWCIDSLEGKAWDITWSLEDKGSEGRNYTNVSGKYWKWDKDGLGSVVGSQELDRIGIEKHKQRWLLNMWMRLNLWWWLNKWRWLTMWWWLNIGIKNRWLSGRKLSISKHIQIITRSIVKNTKRTKHTR